MTVQTRVPITRDALWHRVKRKLAAEGKHLKKARGREGPASLGAYYVLDVASHVIVMTNVDVVALAQELGVLAAWEMVVDAGA